MLVKYLRNRFSGLADLPARFGRREELRVKLFMFEF
jgi:hypothetical protein